MEKIEYILNGKSIWVWPKDEDQFNIDHPNADLASGNSKTLQEDVTVEEPQIASNQETDQSQRNQKKDTEFNWESGSSDVRMGRPLGVLLAPPITKAIKKDVAKR